MRQAERLEDPTACIRKIRLVDMTSVRRTDIGQLRSMRDSIPKSSYKIAARFCGYGSHENQLWQPEETAIREQGVILGTALAKPISQTADSDCPVYDSRQIPNPKADRVRGRKAGKPLPAGVSRFCPVSRGLIAAEQSRALW